MVFLTYSVRRNDFLHSLAMEPAATRVAFTFPVTKHLSLRAMLAFGSGDSS